LFEKVLKDLASLRIFWWKTHKNVLFRHEAEWKKVQEKETEFPKMFSINQDIQSNNSPKMHLYYYLTVWFRGEEREERDCNQVKEHVQLQNETKDILTSALHYQY